MVGMRRTGRLPSLPTAGRWKQRRLQIRSLSVSFFLCALFWRVSGFIQPLDGATKASTSALDASLGGTNGLSRYHQSMLSRRSDRQRFVTGRYPLIVTVIENNPTRKWLSSGRNNKNGPRPSTTEILVNGTAIEKSLASFSRFQWLDEYERRALHNRYRSLSLELLAEINIPKPGYVHILPATGAGASAAAFRKALERQGSKGLWINPWKSRTDPYHDTDTLDLDTDLESDRLWVTGFTLTARKGILQSVDVPTGHISTIHPRSESMTLWPNEVHPVPKLLVQPHGVASRMGLSSSILSDHHSPETPAPSVAETLTHTSTVTEHAPSHVSHGVDRLDDALLVSDGFLVPGKDRGGIYVVENPSDPKAEWTVCLTNRDRTDNWFYHRAVWVDLTGDGRKSILTARAKLRKVNPTSKSTGDMVLEDIDLSRPKNGQLVWLEMPKPHRYDSRTGTPLEDDGTVFDPFSSRHLPWKERVLAVGPDVMFAVADMNPRDDTIEVIASEFFDKKVSLHSIKIGPKPHVSFHRFIDDRCGSAFGGILADLNGSGPLSLSRVIDSGSTVAQCKPGEGFSHVLVTSHECNYAEAVSERVDSMRDRYKNLSTKEDGIDGGSLFAYRVPYAEDDPNAWKVEPWARTTVATGFKVKGQLWNVINPGAPGFVYTFHARKEDADGQGSAFKRPMIAIAGDCAESAYIFRPELAADEGASQIDLHAQYKLMCEIKCGATVGSIAVGYDDLCSVDQESGYAKLYIPCYEKDKILVFAMGSGEDATEDDDGW